MKKLNPNSDSKIEYIAKADLYVRVLDYGPKFLLKEIKIGQGQHSWYWVPLSKTEIDISSIGVKICTFENAINRAVNDPYSSTYSLKDMDSLVKYWEALKYDENNITTVYKEVE